jgi:hypothetical protein
MEFAHDFERVPGVVVITITGLANPADYAAGLAALRRHPRFEPSMPIITDLSDLDVTSATASEARSYGEMAAAADEEWGTSARAVVAPTNVAFGLTRAAQSAADPGGTRMAVVRTFDEAVAWIRERAQV